MDRLTDSITYLPGVGHQLDLTDGGTLSLVECDDSASFLLIERGGVTTSTRLSREDVRGVRAITGLSETRAAS